MKNLIKTLFIILFCEPSREELEELRTFLASYDEYMAYCKRNNYLPKNGFCLMIWRYDAYRNKIINNPFIDIFKPIKSNTFKTGYWFSPNDWTKRHEIVKCIRMIYNHHKD